VALVGGEIAEHPGLLKAGEYDVAGATTGVVEADAMLGPDKVRAGDVVLAMAASGLHSNGYSLVRHVLLNTAGIPLDKHIDDLGRTLGEELLVPTRLYTKPSLELARTTGVHALSHVTGGGLANNLERVLPKTVGVEIDRSTWTPQPIFDLVRSTGDVALADLEMTLNCGVGMVALLPAEDVDAAIATLARYDISAWVAGRVTDTAGGVVNLSGAYQGWA
ncbi:MAG TPA: AIR synthase-related protein, partial [Nocardioides sp.]|nr:AIR synthase-related protein [Nocardioides sp.]